LHIEKPASSSSQDNSPNTIDMLEELLVTFESVVSRTKKVKADFNKLLKQKFVENAENFSI
jgi:hypothetical protein